MSNNSIDADNHIHNLFFVYRSGLLQYFTLFGTPFISNMPKINANDNWAYWALGVVVGGLFVGTMPARFDIAS